MISLTNLLSTTWEAIVQHYRIYAMYVLFLMIPILFFDIVTTLTLDIDNATAMPIITIKDIIIGFFTSFIVTVTTLWGTIAVIYSSYSILQHGTTPDILTDIKKSARLILPIFLISILVGIIITGGFLLLIIPGIIFAVWTMFTYHVYLLEQTTIIGSIKKSTALVRGRFWPLFGRLAFLTIVIGGATLAVLPPLTFLFSLVSLDIILVVLTNIVSAASSLFMLVAITVLYLSCKATPLQDQSPIKDTPSTV